MAQGGFCAESVGTSLYYFSIMFFWILHKLFHKSIIEAARECPGSFCNRHTHGCKRTDYWMPSMSDEWYFCINACVPSTLCFEKLRRRPQEMWSGQTVSHAKSDHPVQSCHSRLFSAKSDAVHWAHTVPVRSASLQLPFLGGHKAFRMLTSKDQDDNVQI